MMGIRIGGGIGGGSKRECIAKGQDWIGG